MLPLPPLGSILRGGGRASRGCNGCGVFISAATRSSATRPLPDVGTTTMPTPSSSLLKRWRPPVRCTSRGLSASVAGAAAHWHVAYAWSHLMVVISGSAPQWSCEWEDTWHQGR